MASHGAVLPRLMQHISLFVINIGNRRPLSVRDQSQTARLIVDSYLFGAVWIFDGGGAALGVIGVESLISVGVHSSGISSMSALRAVLIGKPDHSSFRILLFCHPAQAICGHTLAAEGDGYVLTEQESLIKHLFNAYGMLVALEDLQGNQLPVFRFTGS